MPMLPDLEPHLLYTREFCGKQLRWHFVQDPCDRHKAPDVVFDDITFCPIVDASNEEQRQLAELLDGWSTATDSHPLTALIKLLLSLYTEHQRNRIAAVEDDRILFELAMVAELGCTEMLLAGNHAVSSMPVFLKVTGPSLLGLNTPLHDHGPARCDCTLLHGGCITAADGVMCQ